MCTWLASLKRVNFIIIMIICADGEQGYMGALSGTRRARYLKETRGLALPLSLSLSLSLSLPLGRLIFSPALSCQLLFHPLISDSTSPFLLHPPPPFFSFFVRVVLLTPASL